jgi:hypothetical protein
LLDKSLAFLEASFCVGYDARASLGQLRPLTGKETLMNRVRKMFLAIAIICWCFLLVTPAAAQIVYDNGTPNTEGGFLSDNDGGVRFADDFRFGAPTQFNGIRFWGFYSPSDTPPVNDAFTVVFYGNGGGLPDSGNILSTHVIGNVGRTDTGDDTNGGLLDIYVYEAPLGNITLPAGQYWVSVYNNTPGDVDDNWAWARHVFPGNDARSLDSGATWLHEFSDSELAFQLIVPEPRSIAVVVIAVLVVGIILSRAKKAACVLLD